MVGLKGGKMREIIDFTNMRQIINKYGGADTKKTIIYQNKYYLLKFPNHAKQNKNISYSNNVFSEYLGCHIFNKIGILAQNTILGIYKQENGMIKNVCACEDFTGNGWRLVEFQNLKNSFPETPSSSNGKNTALNEILDVIEHHTDIEDNNLLKQHFWNVFIVDSLIGNYDRHNGNWGILVNDEKKQIKMAPIYDCGSCLYAQLTDEQMEKISKSETEIHNRIYNKPTSTITEEERRINYYEFISSLKNKDCNEALNRIVPKINLQEIMDEISDMPIISEIRKQFYKVLLTQRYEIILKKSYEKLKNKSGD